MNNDIGRLPIMRYFYLVDTFIPTDIFFIFSHVGLYVNAPLCLGYSEANIATVGYIYST